MKRFLKVALGLFVSTSIQAASLPTTIYLNNLTAYTIDGYTAGQPGVSLEPFASNVGVPYLGVITRCNLSSNPKACPVEFYNRETHDLMATVTLDIWKGMVVTPPQLYGKYAHELDVRGWESTPLNNITLFVR